jgi:hypothetical protein
MKGIVYLSKSQTGMEQQADCNGSKRISEVRITGEKTVGKYVASIPVCSCVRVRKMGML